MCFRDLRSLLMCLAKFYRCLLNAHHESSLVASSHFCLHLPLVGQHQLWRNYQELVDQVIESVLIAVGGSIAQLEDALDDIATTDPKGITFYC